MAWILQILNSYSGTSVEARF